MTSIRLRRKLTAFLEETWDHPFWTTTDPQGRTPIVNEAISRGVNHEELIPRGEGENHDIEEEDDGEDDSEDDDEDHENEDEAEDEAVGHRHDENEYTSKDSEGQEGGRGLCDGLQLKEKYMRHEDNSQAGIDPTEELMELLLGLSLALCTEHLTDGQPNSTVLVYFSGILGFS